MEMPKQNKTRKKGRGDVFRYKIDADGFFFYFNNLDQFQYRSGNKVNMRFS